MKHEEKIETAIASLVSANRILAREGVLDGFGHVSIRHPLDPERYFLARSLSPELVTRDDIVEFTLDSVPINQNGRALYAERYIHGAIYQARPEIMAVCHNHAINLIPFGITGSSLRPVFHLAAVIGEAVPVWDIHDDFGDTDLLVTNPAKGRSLARGLGDRQALLMRGHGSVVVGASVRDAVFTAIYLHLNAEMVLGARSLGDIRYLTPGEIDAASAMQRQDFVQERAWTYWCARAGRSGRHPHG